MLLTGLYQYFNPSITVSDQITVTAKYKTQYIY